MPHEADHPSHQEIEDELDALGANLHEGYCWECAESGPVFGLAA
jgi:hypothetical protein